MTTPTAATAKPNGGAAKPAPDSLIEPFLSKVSGLLKAGKLTPEGMAKSASPIGFPWVPPQLLTLLKTPSITVLTAILKAHPELLWHPLVYLQVQHLRTSRGEARRWWDVDTEREADNALRALVEAWVQAVLGAGWGLKAPAKRRGRKLSREDHLSNITLLGQYDELLARLKSSKVRRLKGESDDQWAGRLSKVIQAAWHASIVSADAEDSGGVKVVKGQPSLEDLFNIPVKVKSVPLSSQAIKKWVSEALEVSGEGAIRDRLAYHLLAYRYDRKPNQVRWAIQAARKIITPGNTSGPVV